MNDKEILVSMKSCNDFVQDAKKLIRNSHFISKDVANSKERVKKAICEIIDEFV